MRECRNCEHATLDITPCRECCAELISRIAELETAAQWHPATEPPEDDAVVIINIGGHQLKARYCASHDIYSMDLFGLYTSRNGKEIDGWRDLPVKP